MAWEKLGLEFVVRSPFHVENTFQDQTAKIIFAYKCMQGCQLQGIWRDTQEILREIDINPLQT